MPQINSAASVVLGITGPSSILTQGDESDLRVSVGGVPVYVGKASKWAGNFATGQSVTLQSISGVIQYDIQPDVGAVEQGGYWWEGPYASRPLTGIPAGAKAWFTNLDQEGVWRSGATEWTLVNAAALQAFTVFPGNPTQPIAATQMALLTAQLFNTDGTAKRITMSALEFTGNAGSQFFTVPDGCTVIEMEGCGSGAGGGGGFATSPGGGGGGGGAGQLMFRKPFLVSPGETLTINVPTAGIGGSVGGNGAAGSSASGSLCTVTGSVSGLMVSITSGNGGKAGTATNGGAGGDVSGPLFTGGVAGPAAGVAGTGANDLNTTNNIYGTAGAGGGAGCQSTGVTLSGGRGGRTTAAVGNGAGGATGAVSGNGAGGGGASGFPDYKAASSASGGNGGADSTIGGAAFGFGAGGGGGGRGFQGGSGGSGLIRIFY